MKQITNGPPASGASPAEEADERRRYHQAREVFEYAFSMLEPMHDPEAGWQGRSLHHVSFNLVTENFPQLAHDEVQALLDAVTRMFVERNAPAAGALPKPIRR